MKRGTAFTLALLLILSLLAGCAAVKPETDGNVYSIKRYELVPGADKSLRTFTYSGGKYLVRGTATEIEEEVLYTMNPNGTEFAPFSVPLDPLHYRIIRFAPNDDGSIWVLAQYSEDGFEKARNGSYLLLLIDDTGAELFSRDVSELLGKPYYDTWIDELYSFNNTAHLVAGDGESIFILTLNREGEEELTYIDEYPEFITSMTDGRITMLIRGDDGEAILSIAGTDESYTLADIEPRSMTISSGAGDYPILVRDNISLYGYSSDGERETILNWNDYDIAVVNACTLLPDGRISVINSVHSDPVTGSRYGNNRPLSFTILTPGGEALPYVLSIGMTRAAFSILSEKIFQYNHYHADQRVKVINYGDIVDEDGIHHQNTAALMAALQSDNPPDIYITTANTIEEFRTAGLVTSVTPENVEDYAGANYTIFGYTISPSCRDVDEAKAFIDKMYDEEETAWILRMG
jgi:hypothetical protein